MSILNLGEMPEKEVLERGSKIAVSKRQAMDTESVFTRLTSQSRRSDAKSEAEYGNSRLTRTRSSGSANGSEVGKSKGTRPGTSLMDVLGSSHGREESKTKSANSVHGSSVRQSVDMGAPRVVRKKGTRQCDLRRSSSLAHAGDLSSGGLWRLTRQQQQRDSDSESVFSDKQGSSVVGDDDGIGDFPEEDPEEKTIRAVHTQKKELEAPEASEMDVVSLYDAMRVEMRKVVSEIRSEMEQKSASKEFDLPTTCVEGNQRECAPGESDDNFSKISDHRRENGEKLEKDPEVEKQLIGECLDADAQRYFDECFPSISDAESYGVGYRESESPSCSVQDETFSPKEMHCGENAEKSIALLEPLAGFCAQVETNGGSTGTFSTHRTSPALTDDGLVLPWLHWETDLDFSAQEDSRDGIMICSLTASKSFRPKVLSRSVSAFQTKAEQGTQAMHFLSGISGLRCSSNVDLSSWTNLESEHMRTVAGSTCDRGVCQVPYDVDRFVAQRMWLGHRVNDGTVLVCGGIR